MKGAISGLNYYNSDKKISVNLLRNNFTIKISSSLNADYIFDEKCSMVFYVL